jgi:hypothetical protein
VLTNKSWPLACSRGVLAAQQVRLAASIINPSDGLSAGGLIGILMTREALEQSQNLHERLGQWLARNRNKKYPQCGSIVG